MYLFTNRNLFFLIINEVLFLYLASENTSRKAFQKYQNYLYLYLILAFIKSFCSSQFLRLTDKGLVHHHCPHPNLYLYCVIYCVYCQTIVASILV